MADGETAVAEAGRDFVRDIVKADLDTGRHKGVVCDGPGLDVQAEFSNAHR